MAGPFLPPPILPRKLNKCERCGQQYSKKETLCPHCGHLTDQQVALLKQDLKERHEGNANLGKLFLALAAIIALGLLIFI
ncbi:hypothetical protein [Marinimicrobium alkaliphilum]|uniref:hypothetical protein n=1 Tax=Marinimicrobium alkaliphilum TaxID=2202654 RepID=UPI000DB974C0|nr:hypothetical protein [Marinimicrobium alkaliphilum]